MMNKWILSSAAMIMAVGLQAAPPAPKAPVVSVGKAIMVAESSGKKYVGHLEAIEEVDIRARISGYINKIHFRDGDQVAAGQLLFELEDTTYRAQAQAARAQVDQIKAELKYAEDNYNRQKTLRDSSAVSQSTLDDAERLLASTKAKIDEAEAQLLDAENNLSYCKIKSPINGRIGKATYTQGNYVTPSSEALADIVQSTPIHVNFAISERDYLSMFKGTDDMRKNAKVTLTLADGSTYPQTGTVSFIDNKVDSGTNTLTVWAEVDNGEQKLIPGGFVTVTLSQTTEKEYPAVLLSAIMTDNTGNYIYVVDEDNQVVRHDVTTGPLVGSMQLLYYGVAAGETVITGGTNKTMPGGTVEPFWGDAN